MNSNNLVEQASTWPRRLLLSWTTTNNNNELSTQQQQHLPWILSSILLTTCTAYIIYQLYLHPLAIYPGPLLGKLTPCYDVYHAYIGDKHLLFYHLHIKYGPIVRFSPNSLSINHPAALQRIYSHGANVKKSRFYECFRAAPNAVSTLLATDRLQHARKRRVMGCAFSEAAMKGMEGYVVGLVEDFIGRVGEVVDCAGGEEKEKEEKGEEGKEKWSKCLNMSQWCNWLVFDIMGELVFGKSFGTLGSHIPNRKAIFLLGRAARRNYVVAAMPALVSTGLEKFLPVLRGLYRDRCQYLAFGKQQVVKVMERQQQEQKRGGDDNNNNSLTKRKDIFSLLLTAQDPDTGDNIPLPELWMESNTLIVAGSDTTSTTLAATLYYLLHNPPTLHRLRAEILAVFSTRHEIRMGPKMQSCSYLRAVIDETMRMTPAVGGNLPREVLPGGLEIPELGVFLPEGVDVGVPIYAVQHHADYVVRPFVFDPERWLPAASSSSSGTGGEREEQRHHHPQNRSSLQEVFTPFSIGHRSCLGKPLVYMELSLALARLIFAFDMRLSSSSSSSFASSSEEEYPEKHKHAQKEEKLSERIRNEIKSGKRQPFEYQLLDWFMSRNEGPWVEFRWRGKERR